MSLLLRCYFQEATEFYSVSGWEPGTSGEGEWVTGAGVRPLLWPQDCQQRHWGDDTYARTGHWWGLHYSTVGARKLGLLIDLVLVVFPLVPGATGTHGTSTGMRGTSTRIWHFHRYLEPGSKPPGTTGWASLCISTLRHDI